MGAVSTCPIHSRFFSVDCALVTDRRQIRDQRKPTNNQRSNFHWAPLKPKRFEKVEYHDEHQRRPRRGLRRALLAVAHVAVEALLARAARRALEPHVALAGEHVGRVRQLQARDLGAAHQHVAARVHLDDSYVS
jgi:hypothetical protein